MFKRCMTSNLVKMVFEQYRFHVAARNERKERCIQKVCQFNGNKSERERYDTIFHGVLYARSIHMEVVSIQFFFLEPSFHRGVENHRYRAKRERKTKSVCTALCHFQTTVYNIHNNNYNWLYMTSYGVFFLNTKFLIKS